MQFSTDEHDTGLVNVLDYSQERQGSIEGRIPLHQEGAYDGRRLRGYYMEVKMYQDRLYGRNIGGVEVGGSNPLSYPEQVPAGEGTWGTFKNIKVISLFSTFNESKRYGQ